MKALDKYDLDTPALVVDLPTLEANIRRVAATCAAAGVNWRPHVKGHKSPAIAKKLIAAGAIGITCAKVGEAEVMADAGIDDILVANQIVGATKIARLAALAERAKVMVYVDSAVNVAELAGIVAAKRARRPLAVIIEVDVGMHRCGVSPGEPVLDLARVIAGHSGLELAGLATWEAHTLRIADPAEKERRIGESLSLLTRSAERLREAGFPVPVISCGGTGTFPFCARQAGITEVQVGGGIFSDQHYRNDFHADFPISLHLLSTVISRPTPTRAVTDCGLKSMSIEASTPRVLGLDTVDPPRFASEHTIIELARPSAAPGIGDKVEFALGYTDTTIHLHDTIYGIRDGQVVTEFPVSARGKSR